MTFVLRVNLEVTDFLKGLTAESLGSGSRCPWHGQHRCVNDIRPSCAVHTASALLVTACIKSAVSYACHKVGDSGILAPLYQDVGRCLNNGVATITTIVLRIPICNDNRSDIFAILVFLNHFISTTCTLNGRKVIT